MNRYYESYGDKIYVPKQNMICALRVDSCWTRGRIAEVIKNGQCVVWLVDEGHNVRQHWSVLRYLDDKFLKLKEAVAICKLADIKPINGNRFSDRCVQDFTDICQEATHTIHVKRIRGTMHEVVMTSSYLLDELEDVHVNSDMVKRGYAISTGIESMCIVREKSQDKVAKWLENPDNLDEKGVEAQTKDLAAKEIKIKHYIDPSHFYIHLLSRDEEIGKLQVELQEYVDNIKQTTLAYSHHSWALGDDCAVRVALDNKPISWYRGTVVSIDDIHTEYVIFLMDEGITQSNVQHNDMLPILPELAKIKYGAIRCHLAAVGPNDSIDWTLTAKESFLNSAQKFGKISAEIQEDGGNSLGIIVYGLRVSNGDALSPASCEWMDINEYLVEQGLIRYIDQPTSVSDNTSLSLEGALGPNYNNRQAESMVSMHSEEPVTDSSLVDCGIMQLNEEVVYDLKAWKPAVPIRQVVFKAYVTYVDDDLNFYLHPQNVHAQMLYMKRKINEQLVKEDYGFNDVWKIGQPCLARFLDDNYYRAEILKIDKIKQYCKVAYVDYGNTGKVHYNQIKNIVMFADIPKQAHRYYLDNLDPISDSGRWTYAHTRYCLDNSDGKLSTIRVNPGFNFDNITGPIPFNIKPTGHRDLRSYLISNEWAKPRHTRKSNIANDSVDKNESELNKPVEALPPMVDFDAFNEVEDYQKYFEEHCYDDELIDEKAGSNKSYNFFGDAKAAAAKNTLNGGTALSEFLDRSEFGLLRSSCFIDEKFQDDIWDRIMVHFKPFVLDPRWNQFLITVYKHVIPSILIVSPSIKTYEIKFKAMQDDIQLKIDSIAEISNAIAGTACLAYSRKYESWYRAVILGYKAKHDRYQIVFVDYMEESDVRRSQIRECPAEYMNLPLQVLPVKLHDTKRNRRMLLQDFLRRFYALGHNQMEFVAKLVKDGDIPEVDLFLDKTSTEVFYQPMYVERLFSRNESVLRPSEDSFD